MKTFNYYEHFLAPHEIHPQTSLEISNKTEDVSYKTLYEDLVKRNENLEKELNETRIKFNNFKESLTSTEEHFFCSECGCYAIISNISNLNEDQDQYMRWFCIECDKDNIDVISLENYYTMNR